MEIEGILGFHLKDFVDYMRAEKGDWCCTCLKFVDVLEELDVECICDKEDSCRQLPTKANYCFVYKVNGIY